MNKQRNLLIGVVIPLGLIGIYWFVIRNRKPFFLLSNYDFFKNNVKVNFGFNSKVVSMGESGEMTAGQTYNPNKYKLIFTSKDKIIEFVVRDEADKEIQKKTIDFGGKIVY